MTRPVSLGLLPSGPDPVGEGCVHRQPPARYIGYLCSENKCSETSLQARFRPMPSLQRS